MRMKVKNDGKACLINWVVGGHHDMNKFHPVMQHFTMHEHKDVITARDLPDRLRLIFGKPVRNTKAMNPAQNLPKGIQVAHDLAYFLASDAAVTEWVLQVCSTAPASPEVSAANNHFGHGLANFVIGTLSSDDLALICQLSKALTTSQTASQWRQHMQLEQDHREKHGRSK